MKKILVLLSCLFILVGSFSCKEAQVTARAGVYTPVQRPYWYYQPGYWTWRGNSRVFIVGHWYHHRPARIRRHR